VCLGENVRRFAELDGRRYWRCDECEATFVQPDQLPPLDEELAEYLRHQNDPDDPGYRRFLGRLAEPLLERLAPASRGLDYGCGLGPALAAMLEEAGHRVALYDPYFWPDPAPLSATYDFVTCTETVEHFHRPAAELDHLDRLLRPGGWLAVMTCFQTDDDRFSSWHYRRDPTHVVFYRESTWHYLAAARGWSCQIPRKDVALLCKPSK
jgi:SAM-dependent methyltransferase